MSRRSTIRYTYRDYLTIPEDPSRRHEIVDGELFVSAAPRFRHQEVVSNLVELLRPPVRREKMGSVVAGPVTVHLHDELVVEPDLVFIRRERVAHVSREGAVHGPPDLVVEVLSPSNREYDRGLKRKRYLENGVPEVWIVDAEAETVEVWRGGGEASERADETLGAEGTLVWAAAGRELELPVADFFATI